MNTPERDEGGWESAQLWYRQLFQFCAAIQLLFHERVGERELKVKRLGAFFFFLLHHFCPLLYIAKTYSFYRDTRANSLQEVKGVTSSETCR